MLDRLTNAVRLGCDVSLHTVEGQWRCWIGSPRMSNVDIKSARHTDPESAIREVISEDGQLIPKRYDRGH